MNGVREEDIKQVISKIPYKMCEGQTFLVTGANGFLASYMVDTLMYMKCNGYIKKCTVIALCRSREKAECVFKDWMQDYDFRLLIQSVEEEIIYEEEIDYIIHAASYATTQLFESHAADIMKANIIGCYNLLELALQKRIKSFLFFSSGAVYGDANVNELREEDTFVLDYLDMRNSYAVGKRGGEALCRAYWNQYQVPIKCVRISHTYGPGIDLDDGHVYSDFVKNIIERKNLIIKGDGLACRPFCYVSDAVFGFYQILFCGVDGEMYNMANSDMNVTIKELADLLVEEAFPERNLQVIVEKTSVGTSVHRVGVSTQKLESLGWKPAVNLVDGFRRVVRSVEGMVDF